MTFAFNALGNDGINLLAISSVTTVPSVMKGKVYKKYANDILESSFILNLCLFSIITFYLKAGNTPKYQIYVSNVSVGIVLLTFIGIIAFHIVLRLQSTFLWENGISSKSFRKEQCRYYKRKARFRWRYYFICSYN